MTTYNESQTFCEIENFIQAILANQISVEQFKQQIIPLIKKSRRFFVDGNNYIAAIIVFKYRVDQPVRSLDFSSQKNAGA